MFEKKKQTWSIILIFIICLCCYFYIYHSQRYYKYDLSYLVSIIGVISVVSLNLIWFDHSGRSVRFKTVFFFLVSGGPIVVFVIIAHQSFVSKQLAEHGVITTGCVKELYVKNGRKSKTPYAIFTYKINNKIWTQEVINKAPMLEIGDTLKVLCSKTDPEIFKRL